MIIVGDVGATGIGMFVGVEASELGIAATIWGIATGVPWPIGDP
jgi:hypothetical protein